MLDAKLVSSCFSLPSSARPRFSRLLAKNGVSVNTLQKVELGATRSLETGGEREMVAEATQDLDHDQDWPQDQDLELIQDPEQD